MSLRFGITLTALTLLCILASVWSISAGAVQISTAEIINTLFNLDGPKQEYIINRSRLPRTLLALVTGGALALSGAIIQALLRNPLASPKIIGINSGAALAVLLGTLFFPDIALRWLPVIAAIGAIAVAVFIFALAELRPISPARLALVGIAVGFTCDAGVDYILVTASTYEFSAPLVWLTGSLWARGWSHLNAVWPALIALSALCLLLSFRLDLIRLGAAQATGLGMNVRLERLILLGLATLLAALSVSVVGVLGFVGLMSPHIARKLVGGVHRGMLPVAMLTGMLLVVLADATGRVILPPIEVSAGILTAIFGSPFFIFILLTSRSEDET